MGQKLSRAGAAKKKARDICYAKNWHWNNKTGTCTEHNPNGGPTNTSEYIRKEKKAENQRIGQRPDSDIHHVGGKVGRTERKGTTWNRARNQYA